MVLPDENERYVPTCSPAGMDSGPERNKVKWRCVVPWNSTHNHMIDAGVSMSSGRDVKLLA